MRSDFLLGHTASNAKPDHMYDVAMQENIYAKRGIPLKFTFNTAVIKGTLKL